MNPTEQQLKDCLDKLWNGGGTPEMAQIFFDGEWVLFDLKTGKPIPQTTEGPKKF